MAAGVQGFTGIRFRVSGLSFWCSGLWLVGFIGCAGFTLLGFEV